MKILVIEDNELHRQSARETLAGHDITIVESFDEAMNIMNTRSGFNFEVVLTDMMLPMGMKRTLTREAFKSSEQVPYGLIIALRAAISGAKFVAMVTDTNHHQGAMSAAIDFLSSAYYNYEEGFKPNFVINGAQVMFIHTPFCQDIVGKETCGYCKGSGFCYNCEGTGKNIHGVCCCCRNDAGKCAKCNGTGQANVIRQERKDWGRVLADLTSPPCIRKEVIES
ncbi:MAG: hypothetical protein WC823_05525 [Parcubacteria group bacterium]|jgi:CheY-like chemotaxis protein